MPISSSESPSSAATDFGPYFFAWADEGDAFDPAIHTRFDDDIFEFSIEHQEGDFASLSVVVRNPRVGLLAPGRQIWAWFSWWDGVQAVPLFFGRLVGLPENIADETVTLNFIARPSNFFDQKSIVAATKRVRPYWDAIWFNDSTRFNPDNVLESRPESWCIDRVTHEVSTSNIISGEDGTLAFGENLIPYDSVRVSYFQNPVRSVTMNASVSWDQAGGGVVDMPGGLNIAPAFDIQSYTGEGLAAAWPKPGQSIGGGWSWKEASVSITGAIDSALIGERIFRIGQLDPAGFADPVQALFGVGAIYPDNGFNKQFGHYTTLADGTQIGYAYHIAIPNITLHWHLQLGWNVSRRKTENLSFTLRADVQDLFTLPDDGEALVLSMQTSEVTNAIDPGAASSAGGSIPIGTPLARSFFNTDRGAESVEYLIAVARAHLIARARAVSVEWEIPFETAVAEGLSLRKNASIIDSRLPGGTASGKIMSYALSLSNGKQRASLAIGCVVGRDGAHEAVTGTPDYVDEGYVDVGYQTYSGAMVLPFATDVAYEDISNLPINDDGIDLTRMNSRMVKSFKLLNPNGPTETQEDALARFDTQIDSQGKVTATCVRYAQIEIKLPDLTGGPFLTEFPLNVTDLKIPKTIDLEAVSEGASS